MKPTRIPADRILVINTKALLEHEVRVGNHCHISTGAILNGMVDVGKETFVGSNTTVVQGTKIPEESFIKAGCLIK